MKSLTKTENSVVKIQNFVVYQKPCTIKLNPERTDILQSRSGMLFPKYGVSTKKKCKKITSIKKKKTVYGIGKIKKHLKTENNFTVYETVLHNK